MMRKLAQRVAIPGAIAATLLTTTVLGQAEPPTDPAAAAKVGIVNYEQILQQSEDGKRDLARLTQDEQARTQEAQALANELRELQERFTSQQNSLNPESIAEMRNEIGQKEVSLRRFQEDSRSHLEREQRQFLLGWVQTSTRLSPNTAPRTASGSSCGGTLKGRFTSIRSWTSPRIFSGSIMKGTHSQARRPVQASIPAR